MLEQTPVVVNSCPILSLVVQQVTGAFIGAITMVLTMIFSGIIYKKVQERKARAASPSPAYDASIRKAKEWLNENAQPSK